MLRPETKAALQSTISMDEIYLGDDVPLVEVLLGTDVGPLYDCLIRIANVVTKNAKAQNHTEDMLNNLKLFVDSNVGKLSRSSAALEESNRTLVKEMTRMAEEIKALRETALRRDEYEVDIRRVKSQLQPCVQFVDDVTIKKSYTLDVYVRDLLQTEIPPVYLTPLMADVQQRIRASGEESVKSLQAMLRTRTEELEASMRRQLERVDVQVREVESHVADDRALRERNVAEMVEGQKDFSSRMDAKLSSMRSVWEQHHRRVVAELTSLNARHQQVVELLGFREDKPDPSALAGLASTSGEWVTSDEPVFASMAAEEAAAGEGERSGVGHESSGAVAGQGVGVGVRSPRSSQGNDDTIRRLGSGSLTNDVGRAGSTRLGRTGATSFVGVEADPFSASASLQRIASATAVAESPSSSPAGPNHPRLVARGKSVLGLHSAAQGTGFFGTAVYQSMLEEIQTSVSHEVEASEERQAASLSAAIAQAQTSVLAKVDCIIQALNLNAKDSTLYAMMDAVKTQIEELKAKKVEQSYFALALMSKAERSTMESKLDTALFDVAQGQLDARLQDIQSSVQQVQQALKKADSQLKVVSEAMEESGMLVGSYQSAAGPATLSSNASMATGGWGPQKGSEIPIPPSSHFPGATGSAPQLTAAEIAFPTTFTGTEGAQRKPALPADPTRRSKDSAKPRSRGGKGGRPPATPQAPLRVVESPPLPLVADTTPLPSLHEVVFDMKSKEFSEHRLKQERDGRPVVAPRPPSSKGLRGSDSDDDSDNDGRPSFGVRQSHAARTREQPPMQGVDQPLPVGSSVGVAEGATLGAQFQAVLDAIQRQIMERAMEVTRAEDAGAAGGDVEGRGGDEDDAADIVAMSEEEFAEHLRAVEARCHDEFSLLATEVRRKCGDYERRLLGWTRYRETEMPSSAVLHGEAMQRELAVVLAETEEVRRSIVDHRRALERMEARHVAEREHLIDDINQLRLRLRMRTEQQQQM